MMKKLLLLLGVVLGWGCLMCAPLAAQGADDAAAEETVADGDEGDSISIPEILKEVKYATKVKPKKKAYVYFFVRSHSGCGPCRSLVPKCISLYKEMKGKGAELIMLNCGSSAETAKAWAEEAGMTYPVITPETVNMVKVPAGGTGGTPNVVAVTSWGEVLDNTSGASKCGPLMEDWKKLVKDAKKAERERKAKDKKKAKKKKNRKSKEAEDGDDAEASVPSESDF